jgi:hypothetical protein
MAVQEKPASSEPSFAGTSLPGSLLGSSVLNGRGNGPVKIALMQQMQQTQGNRSVQRFMQSRRASISSTLSSASTPVATQRPEYF